MTLCSDIVSPSAERCRYPTARERERANTLELELERERANARAHRIAESLQQVLLRTLPHGALPGLTVEAFYQAALDEAAVGGDSFDAFLFADGQAAIVVADASGKGLDAAERVAEIRFALRAFLNEHRDPGRALSCLNDFVCNAHRLGRWDPDTFATLTLVVLNGASGEIACLCAGGEPPLILRTDGRAEIVQVCGAALGLLPGQKYSATALCLKAGDAVLLASDGITEASRRDIIKSRGPLLSLEGVAALAMQAQGQAVQAQNQAASLSQIGRAVFEGARGHAGGTFHDDACLLLARRQVQ